MDNLLRIYIDNPFIYDLFVVIIIINKNRQKSFLLNSINFSNIVPRPPMTHFSPFSTVYSIHHHLSPVSAPI